jgi:hypothetical protein
MCGRYLAIGCNCDSLEKELCDSLEKELCELCDQEFDDFDTLQQHMQSCHI